MTAAAKSCVLVAALGTSGCAVVTGLLGAGGADASAFTVDMENYDVKKIDLVRPDAKGGICPGASVTFAVKAEAVDKKRSETTFLESADPNGNGGAARGKMDLAEFAMASRGGRIEKGLFVADADPFAALLGYDVKATYRLDKSKSAARHFTPEYACITAVGVSGAAGSHGGSGNWGSSNGGTGGAGRSGAPGSPGPQLTVYASIVETPMYDRVGIVRVSGGAEQLTLFDAQVGISVTARGGDGGSGGDGGRGGQGAGPFGSGKSGGSGGPGGDGAAGGDGGQVTLVIDDRFPELGELIKVDVSGGSPGGPGSGGRGGEGTPPDKGLPVGPKGPDGPPGMGSEIAGRDGTVEIRGDDVSRAFDPLPPGVRLSGAPRPEPMPAAAAPAEPRAKSRKK